MVTDGTRRAMAPLFVSGPTDAGTSLLSRVQSRGTVQTTVSALSYAPVTDLSVKLAGPHVPALSCQCGKPNPDGCLHAAKHTPPYLAMDADLSRATMLHSFESVAPLDVTAAQSHLFRRAAQTHIW